MSFNMAPGMLPQVCDKRSYAPLRGRSGSGIELAAWFATSNRTPSMVRVLVGTFEGEGVFAFPKYLLIII